jgi:hypothetical protein
MLPGAAPRTAARPGPVLPSARPLPRHPATLLSPLAA